jgi:exportin-T
MTTYVTRYCPLFIMSLFMVNQVFTFLHRMVEVLGPTIFPVLPSALALLLSHTYRIKDIQEFITLTNQVTSRFKETVFGLLNDMLMPFVLRMFELLNPSSAPTDKSEEQREWQELQKSYYVFLQCTLSNNLANVFTSSTNAPHFQRILSTVVQGCGSKYPYIRVIL